MSVIKVANPRTDNIPKTQLAVGQASGVGTVYIKNANGFQANWGMQIGDSGQEQSEIVLANASAPSGTQIVLAANTVYEHPADTPVYALKFNQIVFEKSTSGTAGTATPITDGTVGITPDTWDYSNEVAFTQFDDTAAASTDAFRTRFRNSALTVNTSQSDWLTPTGFTFYSLARMRDRIKGKLWNSSFVTDDQIDDWINEWKDEMVNALVSVNEDYALGTVDVGFGTAGLGTITTGDYKDVRRVWITTNSSDYYQSTKMNINDFLPNQTFSSTHPYHAWQGDTTFQIKPDGSAGTARLVFSRFGTQLVNETDELPHPLRPYTRSFVDFSLAHAFLKDNKVGEYRDKMGEALSAKNNFVTDISSRDKSGSKYIDINEPTSADDNIFW
jgi:hypothetical protein